MSRPVCLLFGVAAVTSLLGSRAVSAADSGRVIVPSGVRSSLAGLEVSSIATDPTSPSTVYAGTLGGSLVSGSPELELFKSTDGGANWTAIGPPFPAVLYAGVSIAIDPATPTTVYAGLGGCVPRILHCDGGLYRSRNAGTSWESLIAPAPLGRIAVDPLRDGTVYAVGTELARDPLFPGFVQMVAIALKTIDEGASWTALSLPPEVDFVTLAVDPVQADRVAAATLQGILISPDGGGSWALSNEGLTNTSVHAVTFAGDGTAVYAATDGGVFVSFDGATNWVPTGLTAPVYSLAIDPHDGRIVYVNATGGIFRSDDAGASWSVLREALSLVNVSSLALNATGATLYVGADGGLFEIETRKTRALPPR